MRDFQSGPGFFAVGFTFGRDGGALAVLERKHVRRTPAPALPAMRGRIVPRQSLEDAERNAWEPHFMLIHAATFAPGCLPSEPVGCARDLVTTPPLDGETSIIIDTTDQGAGLYAPFASELGKGNHAYPITVTRETTSEKYDVMPLADIRGAILSLHESKRLKVADAIPHKNEIGRVIEQAALGADLSSLALAIGIACNWTKPYGARGPWPGHRPPKPGTPEHSQLETHLELRRELRQARDDEAEGYWWPRWIGRR